jgi:hypothetical protein
LGAAADAPLASDESMADAFECSRITPGRHRFHRLEMSFSQGCEWKALISKYIGIIPLSGNV